MRSLIVIFAYASVFAVGGASLEAIIGNDRPDVYAFFGFIVGMAMTATLVIMGRKP